MGRRRKHRRFSPEFKAEAVRLVTATEEPVAKIAQDLGVSPQNLRAWVQAARPQLATPLTEHERSELIRLRREILRPAERVTYEFMLAEKASSGP